MLTILQLATLVARNEAERNEAFAGVVERGDPTQFLMYVWPSFGFGRRVEAWTAARVLHTVEAWTA